MGVNNRVYICSKLKDLTVNKTLNVRVPSKLINHFTLQVTAKDIIMSH